MPFKPNPGWSFSLALAATLAAGAGSLKALQAFCAANNGTGVLWLALALLLLLPMLLLGLTAVRRSASLQKILPELIDHCRNTDIDSLTARFSTKHDSHELQALIRAYNAMLERLQESTSRIRQFSGDASHELRTPLTIVRGETEVALRWGKTAEDYRNTLQSNMEEIERMGRIIEDLLTLAKSESGELPLSITYLSLSDLLQEMYVQANKLATEKKLALHLHHDVDKEIWIKGDDLRLRQLFWNLISNAIRYTPEQGEVSINLHCNRDSAEVTIRDTGIGIEKEHIEHIFERFYRTDAARNRTDGGTGLGLAIAKWVAEAHHGSIAVESEVGKGSAFTVRLPLE